MEEKREVDGERGRRKKVEEKERNNCGKKEKRGSEVTKERGGK